MNELEVSHLRKCYGDTTVVDDLTFHVAPGEIFGLIGPNGAGKSTTMLMIVGLIKPDEGEIAFEGKKYDPRNPDMRSRIGIVPQELTIYPDLTAKQNLRFFGKLYGLSGHRLQERVDCVLELTGLVPKADHAPSTFSGGMSRRLNFGIALLHEPRFVVLDEPTVGIDPQSRTNLLDAVRQLAGTGIGVLYASHYMEEVELVCDRLAIIDQGRLLRQGTLAQLLDRQAAELSLIVAALPPEIIAKLHGIAEVQANSAGSTSILVREVLESQPEPRGGRLRVVLEILEQAGVPLLDITTKQQSLESLFLKLTGRKLRD